MLEGERRGRRDSWFQVAPPSELPSICVPLWGDGTTFPVPGDPQPPPLAVCTGRRHPCPLGIDTQVNQSRYRIHTSLVQLLLNFKPLDKIPTDSLKKLLCL